MPRPLKVKTLSLRQAARRTATRRPLELRQPTIATPLPSLLPHIPLSGVRVVDLQDRFAHQMTKIVFQHCVAQLINAGVVYQTHVANGDDSVGWLFQVPPQERFKNTMSSPASPADVVYSRNASHIAAVLGLTGTAKYGWRYTQRLIGCIDGLPTMRGTLLATNGVLCAIEQGTRLLVGHIQHFIPDIQFRILVNNCNQTNRSFGNIFLAC